MRTALASLAVLAAVLLVASLAPATAARPASRPVRLLAVPGVPDGGRTGAPSSDGPTTTAPVAPQPSPTIGTRAASREAVPDRAARALVVRASLRDHTPASPQPVQEPRSGLASYVRASLGASYLAARLPRGTVLRITGPKGTVTRTVTDYGPSRRLFPGRIVDLSRADFAAVCGDPVLLGTCHVRVTRG